MKTTAKKKTASRAKAPARSAIRKGATVKTTVKGPHVHVTVPAGPPLDPEKTVIVETTPTHVSLFLPDQAEPYSRVHNGPEGSEAADKVKALLAEVSASGCTLHHR